MDKAMREKQKNTSPAAKSIFFCKRITVNEEKKPHPNQYKEPHFTCETYYGPDSDKYIREYQQMKATSFREVLETFNRTELLYLKRCWKNTESI